MPPRAETSFSRFDSCSCHPPGSCEAKQRGPVETLRMLKVRKGTTAGAGRREGTSVAGLWKKVKAKVAGSWLVCGCNS